MRIDCGVCSLRPWQAGDEASLQRNADDRRIWLNLRDRFPHPYTLADAEEWVSFAGGVLADRAMAIEVSGEAVGGIALDLHEDVERCGAEIGYWLGFPYWGRGIVSAALAAMTTQGFATYAFLERIYALPFSHNAASVRVLEKCGYVREGLLRKSAIKDGVVRDQIVFARLR